LKLEQIRNLGYLTDLMIVGAEVDILERDNYIVARSPANPDWHCGNFLLFTDPPSNENAAAWFDAFQREIADQQPTSHIKFGWDACVEEDWEIDAFKERSLEFDQLAVLVREGAPATPLHLNQEIQIRALSTDEEWAAATRAQIELREPIYTLEGYTPFKTAQMNRHRRQTAAGCGAWFGAFLDGRLVGDRDDSPLPIRRNAF